MIEAAQRALDGSSRPRLLRGAGFEALLEVIEPPPHLFIFGSGPDVLPVVDIGLALGLEITGHAEPRTISRGKNMRNLKAVLLDVDGTLVDSNDAHAQAWLEVFERNGYKTSFERIRSLIGKGGDKVIPEITGQTKDSHEGKRLSAERKALFQHTYLPQLRAFPKTEALLRRLRSSGLELVVASSAGEEELRPLLEVCNALPYIQHQTSSGDAERSKPDPDIIQVALQKANCSSAEAVMLGDTPYDVQAAIKASVRTVALRSGGHSDAELSGAIAIYDDPADLLAHFDTSIFAHYG